MTRLFRALTVLVVTVALAPPAAAKDDALSLVPANAVTVGRIVLADLRHSPLSSLVFQHIDRMSTDGEAESFLRDAGLRPLQDVDVLVVATSPRTALGTQADVLVIAEGRFQPERLTTALVSRGAVSKGAYLVTADSHGSRQGDAGAVAFLSASLAVAGNERSVVNALEARANGGAGFVSRGSLASALTLVDDDATGWALIDVPRAARLAGIGSVETGGGKRGEALRAAMKSVSMIAMWATDTGDALQLGAKAVSNDAETLQLLEDALRGVLAAARVAASDKVPEMVPVLRGFDIDRSSDAISIEGSIPATELREVMDKRLATLIRE